MIFRKRNGYLFVLFAPNSRTQTPVMKIAFAVCATLIILTYSCKKSNDQANTPPVLTDTIIPPIAKVDTSTLLKLSWTYSMGAGGTVSDSAVEKWLYDDQRRIILDSSYDYYSQHLYSVTNTFLIDRYLSKTIVNDSGRSSLIANAIYYQHLKDRIDSMMQTSTGYGIQAGEDGSDVRYYYYNQAGRDSLERETQTSSRGAGPTILGLKYYYTGANLDSTINSDVQGTFKQVKYYSNGNRTMDELFSGGILVGQAHYTFSNIPSRGLYIINYDYNADLVSGMTASVPGGPLETETYSYQMDSANRVVAMISTRNGVVYQKQVYTYY